MVQPYSLMEVSDLTKRLYAFHGIAMDWWHYAHRFLYFFSILFQNINVHLSLGYDIMSRRMASAPIPPVTQTPSKTEEPSK